MAQRAVTAIVNAPSPVIVEARIPSAAPTAGLPAEARLLAKAEFDAVFASGLRTHSPHFRLHWLPGTGKRARLGLAIAKRYVKRAVDRNRLKRHARETFRKAAAGLPDVDFVLYAKSVGDEVDGNALQRELAALFAKALSPRRPDARLDSRAAARN